MFIASPDPLMGMSASCRRSRSLALKYDISHFTNAKNGFGQEKKARRCKRTLSAKIRRYVAQTTLLQCRIVAREPSKHKPERRAASQYRVSEMRRTLD